MSKIPVSCNACGGTHENNPSGKLRHARSQKHRAAMAATFAAVDPAKPVLIPGGHPRTEQENEASRAASQLGLRIAQAQVDREKAQHDLDYRNKPKHLHQYGDRSRANFQAKIDDFTESIRLWEIERAAWLGTANALEKARQEADAEMYKALELYVATLFSGDSTILITRSHAADFRIHGLTGKVISYERDGETLEYPEARFGHEAVVYGPTRSPWRDEAETKSAYVGWGSKQMDTLAEAERMIGIYLTATAVAHLLNELAGLES